MEKNTQRAQAEPTTPEKMATIYSNAITEWISADISNPARGLKVPAGYDWQNEIASAMLYIAQNVKDRNSVPALQACTRDSIMTALRDMVIQGLSCTRKQCYFIVYGNQLQMMRSYFGTVSVLGMIFPNLRVNANVIHEGDSYEILFDDENSYHYIANHQISLESLDKPIVAAYGTIVDKETGKRLYASIMTKAEIDKSWSKAKTHNVQNDFPQEMAKRTLINRMCKLFLNSASTAVNPETLEAYNRSLDNEYENDQLQNVTPPESEIAKQKILRGKSKGTAGLQALLDADKTEAPQPQNDSEEVGEEITQQEAVEKPSTNMPRSESKLGREPSVRINEHGEVVPNESENTSDDLLGDAIPF